MTLISLTPRVFETITNQIADYCRVRAWTGVLTVCDLSEIMPRIYFANVNRSTCLRLGVEGKRDINYLAIALSKLAVSIAHGTESGEERNIFGEVPYKGSYIDPSERFVYTFSGASEEEDLEIAKRAYQIHLSL